MSIYQWNEDKPEKVANRSYRRRRVWKQTAAIALGVAVAVGGFAGGATVTASQMEEQVNAAAAAALSSSLNQEAAETTDLLTTESGLPDASQLVSSVKPSVVMVTNIVDVTQESSQSNYSSLYDYYFGRSSSSSESSNGAAQEDSSSNTTTTPYGYGSGVIISQDDDELLIVTNNHVAVIDETQESGYGWNYTTYTLTTSSLEVTFIDGSTATATLKGADADADLAILSVDLSSLSDETKNEIAVATVGSSDELMEGQGVIAIGNALGQGISVTAGYISALDRELTTSDGITNTYIQTDAAINSGNSGGGLFNSKGELIGINTAKISSVGVEGMGYSIPISQAEEVINALIEDGSKVALSEEERGYLGIQGFDVPSEYVSNYGYPQGAYVSKITDGSPAASAGLQLGDIITAVNGRSISTYEALRTQLSYYAGGENVELTVQRVNGASFEETTIVVTLATYDEIQGK